MPAQELAEHSIQVWIRRIGLSALGVTGTMLLAMAWWWYQDGNSLEPRPPRAAVWAAVPSWVDGVSTVVEMHVPEEPSELIHVYVDVYGTVEGPRGAGTVAIEVSGLAPGSECYDYQDFGAMPIEPDLDGLVHLYAEPRVRSSGTDNAFQIRHECVLPPEYIVRRGGNLTPIVPIVQRAFQSYQLDARGVRQFPIPEPVDLTILPDGSVATDESDGGVELFQRVELFWDFGDGRVEYVTPEPSLESGISWRWESEDGVAASVVVHDDDLETSSSSALFLAGLAAGTGVSMIFLMAEKLPWQAWGTRMARRTARDRSLRTRGRAHLRRTPGRRSRR